MARGAVLNVAVLVDAAKANSQLASVGDSAESMGSKLKSVAAAAAGLAIVGFANQAVQAASRLEQAVGGTDAVFGDSAKTVHEWAKDTNDSIRLSATSFETLATRIGGSLKNAGVPLDQLAGKTKDTMQLGADMAARWGTTTEEAIDAIGAALSRGEFDPLEKYNVSLSAAAVETEKVKLKTGEMAGASDKMLTSQARLNLIMQQSKDALGAAASESDTYAAAQENLSAAWENFLAAVGAPLLSALGGILNSMAGLLPLVTPLATAVSGLVGWVLQLPTPLLAAAAALAAWQIIGGLSGIITAVTAAVRTLTAAMKGLQASTVVGAVLLGVVTAMELLDSTSDALEDSLQQTNDTYEKWLSTLQDGKVTENTRDTIALDSATSGLFDTYEKLGISTQAYVDASTGVAGGQEALRLSVQKATNALFQQGNVFGDIALDAAKAGIAQDDLIQAASSGDWAGVTSKMQTYADAQSALTGDANTGIGIMNNFTAALAAGADPATAVANATDLAAQTADKFGVSAADADQAARAMGKGQDAAGDSAAALADQLKAAQQSAKTTEGATFLDGVKRSTDDASRALEIFNSWIDQTTAKVEVTDNATLAWQDGLRDVSGALKAAAEAGTLSGDALAAWDINALASTETGSALAKTLIEQASTYGQVTTAAFEAAGGAANVDAATRAAADAMNASRAQFIGMATDAGLSSDQAAALATQLGILDATQIDPKVFSVIAQDEAARSQVAALQAQGIDPKSFQVTAVTDPATGAVSNVLSYVDKSGATVKVDANTAPATGQIAAVTGSKPATTVAVTADTNAAQSSVQGFTSAQRSTSVTVQANTTAAQEAITALVNQQRKLTISVDANTTAATNAINSIVNGNYTATVTVKANIAPAQQAIASVPSTTAAAAPAPTLMTATGFAAPQAAPATGSANIVINVSGALDPDAVARQIDQVLTRQARRYGGTQLGTTVRRVSV